MAVRFAVTAGIAVLLAVGCVTASDAIAEPAGCNEVSCVPGFRTEQETEGHVLATLDTECDRVKELFRPPG